MTLLMPAITSVETSAAFVAGASATARVVWLPVSPHRDDVASSHILAEAQISLLSSPFRPGAAVGVVVGAHDPNLLRRRCFAASSVASSSLSRHRAVSVQSLSRGRTSTVLAFANSINAGYKEVCFSPRELVKTIAFPEEVRIIFGYKHSLVSFGLEQTNSPGNLAFFTLSSSQLSLRASRCCSHRFSAIERSIAS